VWQFFEEECLLKPLKSMCGGNGDLTFVLCSIAFVNNLFCSFSNSLFGVIFSSANAFSANFFATLFQNSLPDTLF